MAERKKLIPKRFTAIEARKMILSLRSDESGTDGSCSDDSETKYIQTLVNSSDDERQAALKTAQLTRMKVTWSSNKLMMNLH